MKGRLPNLILIGAQKSGSTAVYDWLSQHPDIYGNPGMKDFPFFCEPRYFDQGLDWFAGHFTAHRNKPYILHGYVHYLFLGSEIAQRLQKFNSELKLIALLRNPVERAFSGYLQARKTGNEAAESFKSALQADQNGQLHSLRDKVDRSYLSHGLYAQQLEQYFKVFPREQIHLELYDNIRTDPHGACKRLFNFLSVDDTFRPSISRKNVYGRPRFAAIETAIQRGLPAGLLHKLIPLSARSRIRQKVRAINTAPANKPELDESDRLQLQSYYADDIRRLEELTGFDLSRWKTPDPAS